MWQQVNDMKVSSDFAKDLPERLAGDDAGAGFTTDDDVSIRELVELLDMEALLVTRGKRGMSLFERGKAPLHLPVVGPDEVVDVTGAGDTVMATYVLALCAGAGYPQAAQLANIAGGIVVQKHGTATTDVEELRDRTRAWAEGRV